MTKIIHNSEKKDKTKALAEKDAVYWKNNERISQKNVWYFGFDQEPYNPKKPVIGFDENTESSLTDETEEVPVISEKKSLLSNPFYLGILLIANIIILGGIIAVAAKFMIKGWKLLSSGEFFNFAYFFCLSFL